MSLPLKLLEILFDHFCQNLTEFTLNSKDKNFKSNTKPNKPFLTDLKIMSSILVVRSDEALCVQWREKDR